MDPWEEELILYDIDEEYMTDLELEDTYDEMMEEIF